MLSGGQIAHEIDPPLDRHEVDGGLVLRPRTTRCFFCRRRPFGRGAMIAGRSAYVATMKSLRSAVLCEVFLCLMGHRAPLVRQLAIGLLDRLVRGQ